MESNGSALAVALDLTLYSSDRVNIDFDGKHCQSGTFESQLKETETEHCRRVYVIPLDKLSSNYLSTILSRLCNTYNPTTAEHLDEF